MTMPKSDYNVRVSFYHFAQITRSRYTIPKHCNYNSQLLCTV